MEKAEPWIIFLLSDFGRSAGAAPLNTNGPPVRHLYLRAYSDGRTLQEGLSNYFRFYHQDRKHQSLGYQTPVSWYEKGVEREKNTLLLPNDTSLD